jgi:hypothetical protein
MDTPQRKRTKFPAKPNKRTAHNKGKCGYPLFDKAVVKNFRVGNDFWKYCSSYGRNPIFETPEQLLDACQQYFEWVYANPFIEEIVAGVSYGEVVTHDKCKMQAMTITGVCIFLSISMVTWWDYKNNKGSDFTKVCAYVEQVVYQQKLTGAAAGFFNANIIARELGLVDKKDHTSSDGSMTPRITETMSAKDAALAYKQMIKGGKE